jgi:SPX domain protein involved in polyphosphate accumulation
MEIKTKIHGEEENTGFKRRFMITKEDYKKFISKKKTAEELAKKSVESPTDIQIAREIDYYFKVFNLRPKILVVYDRESYRNDSGLRITFDENLKYRNYDLGFYKTNDDKIYFKDDHNIIMEIKSQGALPLWLVKKLSTLSIFLVRFSKIGRVYQALLNKA